MANESTNNVGSQAGLVLNYRRLMGTKRCNNFTVLHQEDVAHHSYFVTMIAVLVAQDYNKNIAAYSPNLNSNSDSTPEFFDILSVYEKGMFHDIEEAFFSDIPRNIKHHSKEVNSTIERAVKEKLGQIYDGSGTTGSYVLDCNLNAKNGREGKLIEIVDMLELGIYCAEEVSCGNNLMIPLKNKAAMLVSESYLFDDLFCRSSLFSDLYAVVNSNAEGVTEKIMQSIDID